MKVSKGGNMRHFLMLFVCLGWLASVTLSAQGFDEFESEFVQEPTVNDPLEGYNRFMTSFNDTLYIYAFIPAAKGYAKVVPAPIRQGVSNVFDNLLFPVRFANTLLQGKFTYSLEELARFLLNSTAGLAGWNDVAKEHLNIPQRNEDLGQTLGYYGVGSGFYIVLPILGPSNLRDIFGRVGDSFANPISYVEPTRDSIALEAYDSFNTLSFHTKEYEQLRKDVIDIYPVLKELYETRRDRLIKE